MKPQTQSQKNAFTLVEVLVSVSVLAVMMTLIAEMMTRTQNTISTASAHANEHQEARRALDAITQSLTQATMDTVWAYATSPTDPTNITGYQRTSDHHFILNSATNLLPTPTTPEAGQAVFFQAPLGKVKTPTNQRLHQLLNNCGFYIQYTSDLPDRPDFLKTGQPAQLNPERKRFRLMQYLQPAEDSTLYSTTLNLNQLTARNNALHWFQQDITTHSKPIADNILALILTPHAYNPTSTNHHQLEPDPNLQYDSRDFQWNTPTTITKSRRHQLPPLIDITLITCDETSYQTLVNRLGETQAANAIRNALANKFTTHNQLQSDLTTAEQNLTNLHLHHKTLSTTITLRNARWSLEP